MASEDQTTGTHNVVHAAEHPHHAALKQPWELRFIPWLGAFAAVYILWAVWPYKHYYLLPASERPLSSLHELLRPSGRAGLLFAFAGTLSIFLSLSYVVRKYFLTAAWWMGSLRSWLAFHIVTGFLGLELILLHSSLLLRSALGTIALVSLLATIVSGLIGRNISLFNHHPRLKYYVRDWRFAHLWASMIMVVTAVFHIVVNIYTGNLWIFKRVP